MDVDHGELTRTCCRLIKTYGCKPIGAASQAPLAQPEANTVGVSPASFVRRGTSFGTSLLQGNCLPAIPPEAKERSVPLTRYFIFVGGVLLALLYISDWFWDNPSPMPSYGSPIDEAILRIRSEHKWPQKVVLDTKTPIIAAPSLPATDRAESVKPLSATPPSDKPVLTAFAQASPPQKPVAKRNSSARARYRNPSRDGPILFLSAVNPMQRAWPVGW